MTLSLAFVFICFKVLLTLQIFEFLFSLDYDFKLLNFFQKLYLRTFFLKDNQKKNNQKNVILICSNLEYYCCLFRKVCFYMSVTLKKKNKKKNKKKPMFKPSKTKIL